MTTQYRLDTRELDRIAKGIKGNRADVLKAIGFEVEASAKKDAPYDTGALSNSIYTVTSEESGFQEAVSSAQGKNEDIETVEIPSPDENTVRVGPGVNYGVFVELGTSKMAGRPYLFPAVEKIIRAINSGKFWEKLFK